MFKFRYIFVALMFFVFTEAKSQVFTGGGGAIPTNSYVYIPINVSGVGLIDCNFEVCIDITHSFVGDLNISLIAPDGTTFVTLSGQNGGAGNNYTNTCFSMGASTNIMSGTAPFSGDFIPEESLNVFTGTNANGVWQLAVIDLVPFDNGTVDSWSIDFSCVNSNCDNGEVEYVLNLFDSFGDGWDHGSGHLVTIDGVDYGGYDFTTGNSYSYNICLDPLECYDISFTDGGLWEYECSFNIETLEGAVIYSGNYTIQDDDFGNCSSTSNCDEGEVDFVLNLYDSFGDGWNHGTGHFVTINGIDYGGDDFDYGNFYSYDLCLDTSECYDISFTDGGPWEYECTFNIIAADGSVFYSGDYAIQDAIFGEACGCTDPLACNYDPDALQDDGSCVISPLDVSSCEFIYCGNQTGEVVASQYIGTSINYLTIDINEEGVINELFYDVNWHSHGFGSINFNVNNANIGLFDENGVLVQNLVTIGNNFPISYYQNFSSTISPFVNVYPGYTVQVTINSPNFGFGTWASYVNLASISFTVENETSFSYGTTTVDLCTNDGLVNLFDSIIIPLPNTGSWSPSLSNGSLGTFNPLVDTEQSYTYEVVSSCTTQTIVVDVSITEFLYAGNSTVLEICPNDDEVNLFNQLGSDASQLGSWSPVLTNGYEGTFNPASDTENQYTYSVESGCGVSTANVDVQFLELNFPATVDLALCNENTSTALFNQISTVATSGIWSGSSDLSNGTATDYFGLFNPTLHTEGVYTYSVDNAFGCEEDFPVNVSVILEELNAGTDTIIQICSNGESIDLFGLINDADTTGIWQPNLDNGHLGTYNPATDAPGSFIYTVTGECSSVNAEVLINQIQIDAPPITFDEVGTSDNVCFGSVSENYSTVNTPTSSYLWTVSGGGQIIGDSSLSTVEIDWSNASVGYITDAIVLTESYDGCSYSTTLDVEIIANPIPNLSIDDNEICLGESIQFSTTAGYNDYAWTNNPANENSFAYTPVSLLDNQFSVTVTGDALCTTTESVAITIYDIPVINISFSEDEICSGESVEVIATPNYVNYEWTPTALNDTGGLFLPEDNQTDYSVIVTDTNGCTNSASENIVIFPIAEIGLQVDGASTSEICIGENIQLTANAGFDNYSWSNTTVNTNFFNYTPNSLGDNTFYLTTTGIGGCTSSDSILITIFDLPIVDLTLSETEICLGESIEVSSTPSLVNYEWIPASVTASGGTITPDINQTFYSVVATDINGCSNTNSASLVINQINPVDLFVNGSSTRTICIGEEIQLSATQGYTSYSWFPSTVNSTWSTDFQGTYVPANLSDDQFTVTVTNEYGCVSTKFLNITINDIPSPGPIGF